MAGTFRVRSHRWVALLAGLLVAGPLIAAGPAGPPCPPRYDLNVHIDVHGHRARVRQRITWTNPQQTPTQELVFNVFSHYQIPKKEIGLLAKTVEILRMAPSETLDFEGQAGNVHKVSLLGSAAAPSPILQPARAGQLPPDKPGDGELPLPAPRPVVSEPVELPFHWREDISTALVVPLPRPVGFGESVTVALEFTLRLPQKQGRWGQWKGVTFLSHWLPILAVYGCKGWEPVPFIPWHQPFFNEAGLYTARVTWPADQKLGCTGSVVAAADLGDGWQQADIGPVMARDFALLCSARYREYCGQAGPVRVKVLAFPEHEHYARVMVRVAEEAIPVYNCWFGPYPYPEFTIAESFFGWNGNECSGLVMIDERIFAMPHLGEAYVDYLVSHEICHQWWYNVVGTNGYCETWMDEGLATYFSHRLTNQKCGKNNGLLKFPPFLEWLPNINRENYRHYGMYGTIGRGEHCAVVQPMDKFGHVVNLFSMCYDKGGKIVGMIEDRLGEAAFLDFIRGVYARYHFRILRVADFQKELEAYTGRSWEDFFQHWLYGKGLLDWKIDDVEIHEPPCCTRQTGPVRAVVLLRQKGDFADQTVLGFALNDKEHFQVRVPVLPQVEQLELEDPPATVCVLSPDTVRVEVLLPCKPTQIAVDPDNVLVDREPANNRWKNCPRWRLAPVYTSAEETDLTADYDRWNFMVGPWVWGTTYADPWYLRSTMLGVRAGAYRTQWFTGGIYGAYRTDFQDVVTGVDGLWLHWPWPRTQVGFNVERSLTSPVDGDRPDDYDRAAVFGRYVFQYSSSLYLPPMHFVEGYGAYQTNPLPEANTIVPGAERWDTMAVGGAHYRLDYRTPYWDPEGGFLLDATAAYGNVNLARDEAYGQADLRFSITKSLPDLSASLGDNPVLRWLGQTRVAAQGYGGAAFPDQGQFFALGGSTLFRGFDMAERQGSALWVANVEWRIPLAKGLHCDCLDHLMGLRNVYLAPFYDVGEIYVKGRSVDGVAHALGAGLRFDVAWFSFIERTILRIDVAQAINADTPVQFWIAVQQPF